MPNPVAEVAAEVAGSMTVEAAPENGEAGTFSEPGPLNMCKVEFRSEGCGAALSDGGADWAFTPGDFCGCSPRPG